MLVSLVFVLPSVSECLDHGGARTLSSISERLATCVHFIASMDLGYLLIQGLVHTGVWRRK